MGATTYFERDTGSVLQTVLEFPGAPARRNCLARIGRYRVEKLLGTGAFGSVYLAEDGTLDRPVAIKVPNRDRIRDAHERDRFLVEARTVARLVHPGIVRIFDSGVTEDGRPFAVTEYVEGVTLGERMADGPMGKNEAIKLLAEIAEAIHYAHQQGFVHRDLKPANILVDRESKIRIIDFGLAVHDREQQARAGEFSGTVAYMSPEQMRGEVHLLDGRTDIWALGVMLYETMTGQRPFRGGTANEAREQILNRNPKPMRQIDDSIPQELELIFSRCCAREPGDRYDTAGDLARALFQFLESGIAQANPKLLAEARFGSLGCLVTLSIPCMLAVLLGGWLWIDSSDEVETDGSFEVALRLDPGKDGDSRRAEELVAAIYHSTINQGSPAQAEPDSGDERKDCVDALVQLGSSALPVIEEAMAKASQDHSSMRQASYQMGFLQGDPSLGQTRTREIDSRFLPFLKSLDEAILRIKEGEEGGPKSGSTRPPSDASPGASRQTGA